MGFTVLDRVGKNGVSDFEFPCGLIVGTNPDGR